MIHERYDSDMLPVEFSKSVLKGKPNKLVTNEYESHQLDEPDKKVDN